MNENTEYTNKTCSIVFQKIIRKPYENNSKNCIVYVLSICFNNKPILYYFLLMTSLGPTVRHIKTQDLYTILRLRM